MFPIALVAVAVVTIWQNLGLSFILMSAGLQSVPDDLLEAAEVDGAGPWSRFRNVTLPMLSPTIFFAVIVGGIFAFQTFGQIDLLTQGRPGREDERLDVLHRATSCGSRRTPGRPRCSRSRCSCVTLVLTLFQLRFLERGCSYER